jgi:hypothetical protein
MRKELAILKEVSIARWYNPDNSGEFFCFADALKEAVKSNFCVEPREKTKLVNGKVKSKPNIGSEYSEIRAVSNCFCSSNSRLNFKREEYWY